MFHFERRQSVLRSEFIDRVRTQYSPNQIGLALAPRYELPSYIARNVAIACCSERRFLELVLSYQLGVGSHL